MADRGFEKKIARRMVALALEPYLDNRGKFERLYRKAITQTIEAAHAESTMSALRIRHEVRVLRDSIDALRGDLDDDSSDPD